MEYLAFYLALLVVAVMVSFLLSGMEAGVFALSRLRIRHLRRTGDSRAAMLYQFLENPEEFLWTIFVGDTLANFLVIVVTLLLLHSELGHQPVVLGVLMLGLAFAFHILTDLLPKMLFRQFPNRLCLMMVQPFNLIYLALRPFVRLVSWLAKRMSNLFGGRVFRGQMFGNREELKEIMDENAKALSSEERAMIGRVLELQTRTVRQLLLPFPRCISIRSEASLKSAMDLAKDKGFSRLPVWATVRERTRILGILSIKPLLYSEPVDTARVVRDFVKPAVFLKEDTRLEEALRRLQRNGQRMGIVVDPDGTEVGIICLQDILRFIFGEVNL